MLSDPVEQRAFKPDILPQPLGLDPFVAEDFLPFGEKLLIQARLLRKVTRCRWVRRLRAGRRGQMSHGSQRDEVSPAGRWAGVETITRGKRARQRWESGLSTKRFTMYVGEGRN